MVANKKNMKIQKTGKKLRFIIVLLDTYNAKAK